MKNNKLYLNKKQEVLKLLTSPFAQLLKSAFFHAEAQWRFDFHAARGGRGYKPKAYGGLSFTRRGDVWAYSLFKNEKSAGVYGEVPSAAVFARMAQWREKPAKNNGEREQQLLTQAFLWVLSQLYDGVNRPSVDLRMGDFVRLCGIRNRHASSGVLLLVVNFLRNFAFNGDKSATLICQTERIRGGARVVLNAGVAQKCFKNRADLPAELLRESPRVLKGGAAILRHLRLGHKKMSVADFQRESDGELKPLRNAKATAAIVEKRLRTLARALKIQIVLPSFVGMAFFRGVLRFFEKEAQALQWVLSDSLTPDQIKAHLNALGLEISADKPPDKKNTPKHLKSKKQRNVPRYKRNFQVAGG